MIRLMVLYFLSFTSSQSEIMSGSPNREEEDSIPITVQSADEPRDHFQGCHLITSMIVFSSLCGDVCIEG